MRLNSKLPKTFSIFVTKGKKSGYLRFVSREVDSMDIRYFVTIVKKKDSASKFINFDNAKKKAALYTQIMAFDETIVIDDKTQKMFYVKKIGKICKKQ